MERSIKEQVGAATWESWPVGARMAIADAQATIAALQARLDEQIRTWWTLRGVETPCEKCGGAGWRAYASTATWRGGIGGQAITNDVCDKCWGSGDIYRKGADLRNMEAQLTQRTAELEAVSNFIGVKYDAESKTWVSGQAPYLSAGTTKQEACIAAVDALRLACATWETKYRDLQAELERVRGLVKTYADAKIDFDDKRLQEDHHAWRERYTRLVGAETILIALTATSQPAKEPVRHLCGARGFGQSIDDKCPGCDATSQEGQG